MQIRVYYEDTDTGGVVYHSNYLNFCERARSQLFFDRGMKPFDSRGGFVVKDLTAKFIASAKLGDTLFVDSKILELKRASLKLKQRVFLEKRVIFEMDIHLTYLKDEKIAKIPKEFLELFQSLA